MIPARKMIPIAWLICLSMCAALAAESPADETAAVKEVYQKWSDAVVKSDTNAIAALVADDYSVIGPGGNPFDKERIIADLKSATLAVSGIESTDVKVRLHGSTAILTAREAIHGKYSDNSIDGTFVVTETLAKLDGKWVLLAGQMTKCDGE